MKNNFKMQVPITAGNSATITIEAIQNFFK